MMDSRAHRSPVEQLLWEVEFERLVALAESMWMVLYPPEENPEEDCDHFYVLMYRDRDTGQVDPNFWEYRETLESVRDRLELIWFDGEWDQ